MAMFKHNEDKLRAAFADEDNEGWIAPFDPMRVDADELHRLIDDALEQGVIEREDQRATIAIYPLSISEPEALISVNPPGGPVLLGGNVKFAVGAENGDTVEGSVEVLRALVDDANALYRESEFAKGREMGDDPRLQPMSAPTPAVSQRFWFDAERLSASLIRREEDLVGFDSFDEDGFAAAIVSRFYDAVEVEAILGPGRP